MKRTPPPLAFLTALMQLLCLGALTVATSAAGQIDVGNGGDAINCQPSAINALRGYYSLDYLVTYEEGASRLVETQDARANLERIARILQDKIPAFGDSLLKFTQLIENKDSTRQRLWREANFGLVDLKDEYLVDTLPENCKVKGEVKVVQAAIRLTPIAAGVVDRTVTYKYVPQVFRELEKTAPLQLSFLLLHEWLWDISPNVQSNRHINRFLHSESLETLSSVEVVAKLKSFGVTDKMLGRQPPNAAEKGETEEPTAEAGRSGGLIRQLDELHALWSHYKFSYIRDGRVVSLDENEITTSEGQGYAMLRAVWSGDQEEFDRVWRWTRDNLQVRNDALFAWKWKGRVLDRNSAADADTDIALALSIAATRFGDAHYLDQALKILADIWRFEVVEIASPQSLKKSYYLIAGDWAKREKPHKLHVGYLAPYAYEEFARIDSQHPWDRLIESSYEVLSWIYIDKGLALPPEFLWLDPKTGNLMPKHPRTGQSAQFGYDAFPLFWRLATDLVWRGSEGRNRDIAERALAFFSRAWQEQEKFFDKYTTGGRALSTFEGLPLYATVESLARVLDTGASSQLAYDLTKFKLEPLFERALLDSNVAQTPYYLQNWLWFERALALEQVRTHAEFLYFLRPFNWHGFQASFPWIAVALLLGLYPLAKRHRPARLALLAVGYGLCLRYLSFRLTHTLNLETLPGTAASAALLLAEIYSFFSVVLLNVQVGLSGGRQAAVAASRALADPAPTVDILIPIYSEPLDILEATLVGATSLDYAAKRVFVCDDGHRAEVQALAEEFGAVYIHGPKRHAKAGNMNNALAQTTGELVVIFDTDHIPVTTFLKETVPLFADPKLGVVQTPHVFYNEDIFQRSLGASRRIGCEQDMFNHGIQSGRDGWGGSFFVGSGAVFRRQAIESVGGIQLLSITEDIHTSQKLHAAGWTSAFVDKNLAVGLTAENVASHLIQRRRWMLGCLQILLRDNPLRESRLPWRHRLGYFASLYYFLFPAVRVIYWATPLWFLFFHLYPILSDVSLLLGYMLPAMAALFFMTQSLLPGWPRLLWNSIYESAISFPLARAMLDLFLPKNLGFKVTPKGHTSTRRRFDHATVKITLVCALVNLVAVLKGFAEFFYFGIEKDAYFFNLAWGSLNLLLIGIGLLVAWERPQRRVAERVKGDWPVQIVGVTDVRTVDLSLTGAKLAFANQQAPATVDLRFVEDQALALIGRKVHSKGATAAYAFDTLSQEQRRLLTKILFTQPRIWEQRHELRTRHSAVALWALLRGIVYALKPARASALILAVTLLAASSGGTAEAATPTEMWYLLNARTNMKIGNTKAAIEALEKLVAIDPSHKEAQRTLGLAYERQGLTDKAVAQFDRYLSRFKEADPEIEFKQANFLLAPRYEYRQADAIKLFLRALESESRYEERRKLAQLFARKSATAPQAIAQYEILAAERPDDQDMRAEYRKALLWSPRTRDQAITEFETYTKDQPKDLGARRQLGLLLAQRPDRAGDAEDILGDACRRSPRDREACLAYAHLLARDPSKFDAAEKQYKALLAQKREFAVEMNLADLLARDPDKSAAAADAYRGLVARQPGNALLRVKHARVLARDEDNAKQAAAEYEQALKLAPKDQTIALESHTGLARMYAWTGEKDRALYHSEKARELRALTPNNASEMSALGSAMLRGREPHVQTTLRLHTTDDVKVGSLDVEHGRPLNAFMDAAVALGSEAVADDDAQRLGMTAKGHIEGRWRNFIGARLLGEFHSVGADSNRVPYELGLFVRVEASPSLLVVPSLSRVRARRDDSLAALVGDNDGFGAFGSVVDERLVAAVELLGPEINPDYIARLRVESGSVRRQGATDAVAGRKNTTQRAIVDGTYVWWRGDSWRLATIGAFLGETYDEDCSLKTRTAANQCGDGYFSPKTFLTVTAAPQLIYEVRDDTYVAFDVGPKFESEEVRDGDNGSRIDAVGASASLTTQVQTTNGWRYGLNMTYRMTRRSQHGDLRRENRAGSVMIALDKRLDAGF